MRCLQPFGATAAHLHHHIPSDEEQGHAVSAEGGTGLDLKVTLTKDKGARRQRHMRMRFEYVIATVRARCKRESVLDNLA